MNKKTLMSMMTCLVLAAMALFLCNSCASNIAKYSIGLDTVESPVDAKQQFGETKVVIFEEDGISKYRYEDDYIDIVWYVGLKEFYFNLTNKSENTLKINWDDVSYIDIDRHAKKVAHSGAIFRDRYNTQIPTTLPKGTSISEYLIPIDNIVFENMSIRRKYLLPCVYQTPKALKEEAPMLVGQKIAIMLPFIIENIQNEYTFTFNIDKLLNELK